MKIQKTTNLIRPIYYSSLLEQSETLKMQSFFFLFFVGGTKFVGHAFLSKTVETGDKNRGNFHCMQMSLVMSMRYIFGDDWNDACKFGNDVIFLEWRPLIFV